MVLGDQPFAAFDLFLRFGPVTLHRAVGHMLVSVAKVGVEIGPRINSRITRSC
jgi:hypothetical protein